MFRVLAGFWPRSGQPTGCATRSPRRFEEPPACRVRVAHAHQLAWATSTEERLGGVSATAARPGRVHHSLLPVLHRDCPPARSHHKHIGPSPGDGSWGGAGERACRCASLCNDLRSPLTHTHGGTILPVRGRVALGQGARRRALPAGGRPALGTRRNSRRAHGAIAGTMAVSHPPDGDGLRTSRSVGMAERRNDLIDLISAVASGDASREDVVADLRKKKIDA